MYKVTLSKNTKNILFLVLIATFSFVLFEPLLKKIGVNALQEYAIILFSTVVAAIVTMMLLSKQSENEETKDRNDAVFAQKVTVYTQTIDFLQEFFTGLDDNNQMQISRKELMQIEFLLAKIIMIGNEKTINEFRQFYQLVSNAYAKRAQTLSFNAANRLILFRFADYCREELGLTDTNLEKKILEDIVLHGELLARLEYEEQLHPKTIATLKDIYGYLVFNLELHPENIDFTNTGFTAFTDKKQPTSSEFLHCTIQGQTVYLALKDLPPSTLFTMEIINGQNCLVLKESDRKHTAQHFATIEAAIKKSTETSVA